MNYFELLGLNEVYNIDFKLLSQNYILAQARYHPDLSQDLKQKTLNQDISSNINKAYLTLKDDFQRAMYLASLKDIKIDNNPKAQLSDHKLQKIWCELEQLEDTQCLETLHNIYQQKTQEKQALLKELSQAFTENDRQLIIDIILSFKYIVSMINNIKFKISNAAIRN